MYNCLFSDMDLRDESYVPEGWLKTTRNERVVFLTQLPNRVVIQSKRMIKDYQKQGRYLGADPEKMDFRQLVMSNSSNVVGEAKETSEKMEVDQDEETIADVKKNCAVLEMEKVHDGTKRLEINPNNTVKHREELESAAQVLKNLLVESSQSVGAEPRYC